MKIDDIHRVLVVGAGTMGRQISLQCATHRYNVTLYDVAPQALEAATSQLKQYGAHLVAWGRMTQQESDAALARITTTTNASEAASGADLLSESVPEDPKLKGRVLAEFNRLCPSRTIFTTNTSDLMPSSFAKETGRPSQFAALHFHQHVWEANIVDIMPHPGTSQATVDLLKAFAESIGETPIVLKKEHPAYVFNYMLQALTRSAVDLVMNDVASVEDVDRAWIGVTKTVVGPFGMLDFIGLDLAWQISEKWAKSNSDPQQRARADFLRQYVDKGWLGVKSGRGFYHYK
ncbi:MAG: 3-hydroxyacyl-CoA dehydrogenase [Dehalococcoidia bacterium]|nr:3-hydroxyacyl-CoA dehydrogenase [Dehalococcoidia bacterium]